MCFTVKYLLQDTNYTLVLQNLIRLIFAKVYDGNSDSHHTVAGKIKQRKLVKRNN